MGFFPGGAASSSSRAGTLSKTSSKTDILGRKYAPFANPFFDHASTYLPSSIKSLFTFCRYYHLSHGIINSIDTKAAEYPITDLILQHPSAGVRTKWEELMGGSLNYRVHQLEINLDYYVYGNAFVSPSFPFRKKLICQGCRGESDAILSRKSWRYTNHRFWLTCEKCGHTDWADSRDDYYPKPSGIGLIRWNPENVSIFYNETTGRVDYSLEISSTLKQSLLVGKKSVVATTPDIFLQAVKAHSGLVFNQRSVFHLRRPQLSSAERGWGPPLLMPVLKDAFYMQVMKKAQETALMTFLLPQTFLYPQPATNGADPFTTVDLRDWRGHIQRELARQRLDPAYYGILPFPLGQESIGGNGRNLLLMQEIESMGRQISIGMGFPADLTFGQGTYAGTSVSMRMVENFFLSNVYAQHRLAGWFMAQVGAFLNWPVPVARFKPFRMADDLQRQAFALQLNQLQKISDTSLLSLSDFKLEDETALQVGEAESRFSALKEKQLLTARLQGETGVVQARYQAKAQGVMQEAQQQQEEEARKRTAFAQTQGSELARPAGITLAQAAAGIRQQLEALPEDQQRTQMESLRQAQPEMAELVQQNMMSASTPKPPAGVDMRPQPEQLPPRRA